MSICAACNKDFKRSKGHKKVYCIYCSCEFHRQCNNNFVVNEESDTEITVICRQCVRAKILRADKLEKSIVVLTKQVADLSAKVSDLCSQSPPFDPETNSASNQMVSSELLESKILDALKEQKQQDFRKLNLFVRGMKHTDDDKKRFAQICVAELNLTETEANDIKMIKRVGHPTENFHQPMIVSFNSAQIRRKLLKNAPNLRHFTQEKIFISPDLTKKQLEANKIVVAEYKLRKSNGENVRILKN